MIDPAIRQEIRYRNSLGESERSILNFHKAYPIF